MKGLILSVALLAALAVPLGAVETSSAESSRNRETAPENAVSVKPLLLFSMRDRLDPFMAYPLLTVTASTEYFTIAGLSFSGLLEIEEAQVALFRDVQGKTFTLKGSTLYSPENMPVKGVRGRVIDGKKVLLEQGERKLYYTSTSTSKRLDTGRTR